MKWMIAVGLACVLHVGAYHSTQHNFSINIPGDWKVTEHESKKSKRFEKALTAHSKKTCTVIFDRYYEQALSINILKHRAKLEYEDLEETSFQQDLLTSLERSLKGQIKTRAFSSPIKSKKVFRYNDNYYFAFEYLDDSDLMRKKHGLYYQIYTPSAVFSVTLSSPKEDIFNQNKELFEKIALSLQVKGE